MRSRVELQGIMRSLEEQTGDYVELINPCIQALPATWIILLCRSCASSWSLSAASDYPQDNPCIVNVFYLYLLLCIRDVTLCNKLFALQRLRCISTFLRLVLNNWPAVEYISTF